MEHRRDSNMADEMNTVVAEPAVPKKPVNRKKKHTARNAVVSVIVIAALIGGGVWLKNFLAPGEEEQGEIYSQPAMLGSLQSSVSGSGNANAKESAAITLTQSGTVQEVFVTSGQTVTAGQPLYTIFSQAAEDAVTAAREKVSNLNKDMNDLRQDLDELTVRAPFAGKLVEVSPFTEGLDVAEGATVATLVNDRQLKLSLYFSYAYENDIEVGQAVHVSIPAVMGSFTGSVEQIHKVHFISPEGGDYFEVVAVFDNPGTLTEGMTASATLTAADGSSIFPYESVKTEFYESREIKTKTTGPLLEQHLLRYASVEEGDVLMVLGSDTIESDIRAKQKDIDAAQETLDEAQKALNDFNAVAPIDGTVTSCTLTPGAEVKSGDTVLIISNNTTMLVTINVDDKNISFIHPGDFVSLDWNGQMYQGEVTAINMGGAQAGQGMTNYPVTLTVDNFDGSLMEGAWLRYSFVTSQSDDCIIVPTTSVKYFSDTEGNRQGVVFVRRDSRPEDTPELDLPTVEPGRKRTFPSEEEGFYPVIVETGISDAENVEIISGVSEGDEVFINYTVSEYGSNW